MKKNKYIGPSFDDLLKQEGTLEAASLAAVNKIIAEQASSKIGLPYEAPTGAKYGSRMMKIYKDLKPERWFRFSLMEQLANLGTDVERAICWKAQADHEGSKQAFFSALELLDLTIADPKNIRRGVLRELCPLREALVDYFMYDNEYKSNDEIWSRYFYEFAYAAAMQKGR